jgi:preprotein translocase subunit SecE
MTEKSEQQAAAERSAGARDIALMVVAAAALLAGLWAFYHYDDVEAAWIRWLIVLGAFVAALLIALASKIGRDIWNFIQGSRVELRKVVWPNREETIKTSLAVFVFVAVAGVFFWGLDLILSGLARKLTGAE